MRRAPTHTLGRVVLERLSTRVGQVVLLPLLPTLLATILNFKIRAEPACRPGYCWASLQLGSVGVLPAFAVCVLLRRLYRRWRLDPLGPRTAFWATWTITLIWLVSMVYALVRP